MMTRTGIVLSANNIAGNEVEMIPFVVPESILPFIDRQGLGYQIHETISKIS